MSILLQYFRYFTKVAVSIGMLFVATCIMSMAMFSMPFISKFIYDKLIPTSDRNILILTIVLLMIVYALYALSNLLTETLTVHIRGKLITSIRNDISREFLSYKFAYFKRFEIGAIVQRLIPEIDTISYTLAVIVKALAYLFQLLLFYCVTLFFSGVFFLICVAALIAYVLWHSLLKEPIGRVTKKTQYQKGDLYSYLFENLHNIKSIKLFNCGQRSINNLEFRLKLIKKYSIVNSILRTLLVNAYRLIDLCLLSIVIYSMYRISSGQMSVGYYLLFTMLLSQIITPINFLLELGNHLQSGKIAAQRINEICIGEVELSGKIKSRMFNRGIEYRNVEFQYDQNRKILDGISFIIQTGSLVAFVGKSGCGKSTIVQLLIRLYEPSVGSIYIDETPVQSYDLTTLRENIVVLSQDFFLFNDTIRNNIDPNNLHKIDTIHKILEKADLAGFSDRLEYGVGEGGWNLSGGERQRLSIARLLAKSPRIIVLDEATSNLDPKTESIIMNSIQQLRINDPSLIIIMITHRAQHLSKMDTVYYVDGGKIVDQGTHAELNSRNTHYVNVLHILNKI